jgi:hypothetical protein
MLAKFLESEPYPHYEAHPTQERLLVRTEENGVRTVGRFVNRVFVAETSRTRAASFRRKPAPSRARDSGQTSRARAVSAKVNTSRSGR